MPRPVRQFAIPTVLAAVLTVSACSPDNLASAGDSLQAIGVVATADPALPDPAVQELAPACTTPNEALVTQLAEQLNAERVRLGRSPARINKKLTEAAQAHACDMATMGRLTVAGSNGSSVVDRVRAVKYGACSSAQLIGRSADGSQQVARWMGYKPDQEILIHQKFDDAGIGVVQAGGSYYWSVVLTDNCG